MRTVLIGAVESSRVALECLVEADQRPELVVTLPPTKAGRHSDFEDLRPVAGSVSVPVLEAADGNANTVVDAVLATSPDYIFVIGWSQIITPALMAAAGRGCIGFHPSKLPAYRGRAVVPWTILRGERTTGSSLFWIDEGVDTGDILDQVVFDVAATETARTLYDKHVNALRAMLRRTIPRLRRGEEPRTPQGDSGASYCAKRTEADGIIEWGRPAAEIWTLIRAVGDPYPGAFTYYRNQHLTIWSASLHGPAPFIGMPGQVQQIGRDGVLVQCGDGLHISLNEVQLANGPRSHAADILRIHAKLGIDLPDLARYGV